MEEKIKNINSYKIDGWNNFCRVFELPESYPQGYCFGGGKPVNFQMVDWFNPVCELDNPAVTKEVWEREVGEIEIVEKTLQELYDFVVPFLLGKTYIIKGKEYLVIFNFGATILFKAE